MNYEQPDKIPESQNDPYILFSSANTVSEMRGEWMLGGLRITDGN